MQVELPDALAKYVQEKVASGEYASADAVLVKAVEVMRNVEEALPGADDDLRCEIDLGLQDIDAGRVSEWDVEGMKADLLRQLDERRKKAAK